MPRGRGRKNRRQEPDHELRGRFNDLDPASVLPPLIGMPRRLFREANGTINDRGLRTTISMEIPRAAGDAAPGNDGELRLSIDDLDYVRHMIDSGEASEVSRSGQHVLIRFHQRIQFEGRTREKAYQKVKQWCSDRYGDDITVEFQASANQVDVRVIIYHPKVGIGQRIALYPDWAKPLADLDEHNDSVLSSHMVDALPKRRRDKLRSKAADLGHAPIIDELLAIKTHPGAKADRKAVARAQRFKAVVDEQTKKHQAQQAGAAATNRKKTAGIVPARGGRPAKLCLELVSKMAREVTSAKVAAATLGCPVQTLYSFLRRHRLTWKNLAKRV